MRCESLQSLDQSTTARLLHKNYSLLVCMAPLTHQLRSAHTRVPCFMTRLATCRVLGTPSLCPPVLGPGLPELSTAWYKLYLYSELGAGPASLLLPRGWKLRCLPPALAATSTLLVTTWGHEATEVAASSVLTLLQDALLHSPVLLQVFSSGDVRATTKHIAFPCVQTDDMEESVKALLTNLESKVDLHHTCGYVTLVNFPRKEEKSATENTEAKRESSPAAGETVDLQLLEEELDNIDSPMAGAQTNKQRPNQLNLKVSPQQKEKMVDEWKVMDISYGIPLFDMSLNCSIISKIMEGSLVTEESLARLKESLEKKKDGLLNFINDNSLAVPDWLKDTEVPFPTNPVWFDGATVKPLGHLYNK